jgi:transcriptional regulator with XRE-family HTH domain
MKDTLAQAWIKLREKRGISQRELARLCGLSNVTSWKAENGTPLRWETLHTMLQDGLGVRYGSLDYEKIHRLWMEERSHIAETRPTGHAKRNPDLDVLKAVTAFRRKIAKLTPQQIEAFMAKVSRIKI